MPLPLDQQATALGEILDNAAGNAWPEVVPAIEDIRTTFAWLVANAELFKAAYRERQAQRRREREAADFLADPDVAAAVSQVRDAFPDATVHVPTPELP